MMTTWSAIPTLDRVFDEVLRSAFRGGADATTSAVAADIRETNEAYTFQFDVPGVKAENVAITLTDRVLEIRGTRYFEAGQNEKVTRGRPHGPFAMSYALPTTVDGENLSADLADGVLTIRVPKHPKAQPRRIPIANGTERKTVDE